MQDISNLLAKKTFEAELCSFSRHLFFVDRHTGRNIFYVRSRRKHQKFMNVAP